MDIQIFSHMWAAGVSTIGMALGFLALSFALNAKKQFGGVFGKAMNYVVLSFSCILLILAFYYTSGIYFAINGLRYPSWATELMVSTFLSLSLVFAFLAAKTLKKGAEFR